jgi:hypothetical protein
VTAFWDFYGKPERTFPWGEGWESSGGRAWTGERSGPVDVVEKEGDFAAGRTPAPFAVEHLFGNVSEVVREAESGDYVAVGGSFANREQVFQQEAKFRGYLRGEDPARRRTVAPGDSYDDVGFRCVLQARKK